MTLLRNKFQIIIIFFSLLIFPYNAFSEPSEQDRLQSVSSDAVLESTTNVEKSSKTETTLFFIGEVDKVDGMKIMLKDNQIIQAFDVSEAELFGYKNPEEIKIGDKVIFAYFEADDVIKVNEVINPAFYEVPLSTSKMITGGAAAAGGQGGAPGGAQGGATMGVEIPGSEGPAGETPTIQFHVWDCLTSAYSETLGYGMYTYVFLGLDVEKLNNMPEMKDKRKKYENLLNNITSFPSSTIKYTKAQKEHMNIFYIPAKDKNMKSVSLKSYNSSLARSYITSLCFALQDTPKLRNRLGNSPGPFLISTLEPIIINDENPLTQMLYADLTDTNTAIIEEVVKRYKNYLCNNNLKGIDRFNPIIVQLMQTVTNANDNVKIIIGTIGEIKEKLGMVDKDYKQKVMPMAADDIHLAFEPFWKPVTLY